LNKKSNRHSRSSLYEIALAGILLVLVFGMGGLTTAKAQQPVTQNQFIFLPLIFNDFPTTANQTLTVIKSGDGSGTITSSPAGINCGSACSALFTNDTSVTLTATPNAGSTFIGWSGSGCSDIGTCIVTMNAARSVTATFAQNSYQLRIGFMGSGTGTITSDPSGINCSPSGGTCSSNFPLNTIVTLTATPAALSNFSGWVQGDCSGNGTCELIMTGNKQIAAAFDIRCSGIGNCDFESGPNGQWLESSFQGLPIIFDCTDRSICNGFTPHSGNFLAWLGGVVDAPEVASITQQISVQASAHMLVYWQWIDSKSVCGSNNDIVDVFIKNTKVDHYELCSTSNTTGWVPHNIDLSSYLYPPQVTLLIQTTTNGTEASSLFIDDVSLQASESMPPAFPAALPPQESTSTSGRK
jgi:hypothetical protein